MPQTIELDPDNIRQYISQSKNSIEELGNALKDIENLKQLYIEECGINVEGEGVLPLLKEPSELHYQVIDNMVAGGQDLYNALNNELQELEQLIALHEGNDSDTAAQLTQHGG